MLLALAAAQRGFTCDNVPHVCQSDGNPQSMKGIPPKGTKVSPGIQENGSSAKSEHAAPEQNAYYNRGATVAAQAPPIVDLVECIHGLYRVLDLVSEQGSNGLVDKVIISQNSLGAFMNELSPGSYASVTKVDFAALDRVLAKPVGIYGSKVEIVRFLRSIDAINHATGMALLKPRNESSNLIEPILTSGLYILKVASSGEIQEGIIYVIYWPEDTTWNDNATSPVRRNRVTFMRYLTKIADQVIAMISDDHAKKIVWQDQANESSSEEYDDDEEESDRLFSFEVSKTIEQEENVTSTPGFIMEHRVITANETTDVYQIDPIFLQPQLVGGETKQAFMQVMYKPSAKDIRPWKETWRALRFNDLMKNSLELDETLSADAIDLLMTHGLTSRIPEHCGVWKTRKAEIAEHHKQFIETKKKEMHHNLSEEVNNLESLVREAIVAQVLGTFPHFDKSDLVDIGTITDGIGDAPLEPVFAMYPQARKHLQETLKERNLHNMGDKEYKVFKKRIIILNGVFNSHPDLEEDKRRRFLDLIFEKEDLDEAVRLLKGQTDEKSAKNQSGWGLTRIIKDFFLGSSSNDADVRRFNFDVTDSEFLNFLSDLATREPLLADAVSRVMTLARNCLRIAIQQSTKSLTTRIRSVQQSECQKQIDREAESMKVTRLEEARLEFIRQSKGSLRIDGSKYTSVLQRLEPSKQAWSHDSYEVEYVRHARIDPVLRYIIYPVVLTEADKQMIQVAKNAIPNPKIHHNSSFPFELPVDHRILFIRILEDDKLLLVVDDRQGTFRVFLEDSSSIEGALRHPEKAKKILRREKMGEDVLLAYDEQKRMLAVCSTTKPNLSLHVFVFDETYTSLQGMGTAVNLVPWYDGIPFITHMSFVCGNEELVLVDGARARIFSLITQQFRPSELRLEQPPRAIYSSPDGSCLMVGGMKNSTPSLWAYHWSNFGLTDGIPIDISEFAVDAYILTSVVKRSNIHLIGVNLDVHRCTSLALNITSKITEFTFEEQGDCRSNSKNAPSTAHNCLIDCHAEVWTRFPVVPAVRRRTILSSAGRVPRSLLFITSYSQNRYSPYFSDLITRFEKAARKPVETELSSIVVSATDFDSSRRSGDFEVSSFKAGEWVVDILCLIPIHIAVTRDNRFIPLKDGVWSAELERSLLGANVGQIVDTLSFGWYESLFQSYMASKPVKVVSSMGEQSVGKSFALNHLVDTSFAGSAMRTTEGVWMSVNPTDDALIVALDFEGVHSIERSAQEDTLLVLFNVAISNLVLFRNNFALSRDITGLFQSFQSSSSVLDPAANPSLFQSTLVIIIKDVPDSDKAEITREFRLKFQDIVQLEQGSNFISRLHRGRLNIIPWPVIESRQFYTLFSTLKRCLDKEPVTHTNGAIFLQTLKTLMAKLKANDWGALSQNLASHRAQHLRALLPKALAFGATEIEPEIEPLKDFDTDSAIDKVDTSSKFFVQVADALEQAGGRERVLKDLRLSWHFSGDRHSRPDDEWIAELSNFLDNLAGIRVEHVQEWLFQNTARFSGTNAEIEMLRREFEVMAVDLKSSVKLCAMQCATCHLLCLHARHHEGHHDCQTSHHCIRTCEFMEDHPAEKPCGLPAGHPGLHICDISEHLCGKPCHLNDKRGCLQRCTKVFNHEDSEHACSAATHDCSHPCELLDIRLLDGRLYSCPETCRVPSHQPHERHVCENRLCPVSCQLCKRLCTNQNHLHGLDPGAIHLCDQDHSCAARCAAPGICQIDTAPQSIEATFTGRHETFQYTKYSQVSKRLPCVIPIPAGQLEHRGTHSHEQAENVFHHCESRCENCGYFCTLPLGHPQQEHETSHGSMSRTKWAVDGPDGTVYELDGRRFSSSDDGAPMLCSLVCRSMGRHPHLDYCRALDGGPCSGPDIQHITTTLSPNPQRAKDWISHNLFWRRTGFKDPYSQEDQNNFAKCDAMCSDSEHAASANGPAQPSYCTLPIFHPPRGLDQAPGGIGYVSNDGHSFVCRNPVTMQQAFHVIFVIDRSGSMSSGDRRPLANSPGTARIVRRSNNRLGAVYSSLYAFWMARHAALNAGSQAAGLRTDAYTVLLFNRTVGTCVENDFQSSPDELLDAVLTFAAGGGTNYNEALRAAEASMNTHWSTDRAPIVIFLSDGECSIDDNVVQNICRRAVTLGKALSFHAVSFGRRNTILRRMAQIATDVQSRAPQDPLRPAVSSAYTAVLDTVRLADTFMGIAESLRKPRGSLLRN